MPGTQDQLRLSTDGLWLVLCCVLACGAFGWSATSSFGQTEKDATRDKNKPASVAEAIKLLAADSFQQREDATQYLWKAGEKSIEPLRKARQSNDPEMVHRARRLLYKLEWGIYPNTTPKVVALIKQYQQGAPHQRRILARQLFNAGTEARRSLFKIGQVEPDEITRATIADSLAPYVAE